jgi:hypothetical protein
LTSLLFFGKNYFCRKAEPPQSAPLSGEPFFVGDSAMIKMTEREWTVLGALWSSSGAFPKDSVQRL